MHETETVSFRWRHLPHGTVDDKPYFVTIRLAGSLPSKVVEQLQAELEQLRQRGADKQQLINCQRRQFLKIESILDAADGDNCYLKQPEIAQIVLDSFEWLSSELEWEVFALTVMANHVHGVLQHFGGRNGMLSEDLGRVKSYTAHRANVVLGRKGILWQDENFDHWIRNAEKFEAAIEYTKNNPVKAGLVDRWQDWPWTRVGRPSPADQVREKTSPIATAFN